MIAFVVLIAHCLVSSANGQQGSNQGNVEVIFDDQTVLYFENNVALEITNTRNTVNLSLEAYID